MRVPPPRKSSFYPDKAARAAPELRWLPASIADSIRGLALDCRSGSAELALRACKILARCESAGTQRADRAKPAANYVAIARAVTNAQPSMAAVWNVCYRWLRQLASGTSPRSAARAVARELAQAQRDAALRAAELIPSGATVATYSASSTVLSAVLEARRKGRRFRVLCAEGRPMCEGRSLALRLAGEGIPAELLTDAGVFASLPRADLVLIGCDAVIPDGFVNKIGTRALLCLARESNLPLYVVADTFKFLPASAPRSFCIREEDPDEVWKGFRKIRDPRFSRNSGDSQKSLSVRNFYFEVAPLAGCSGIVTEKGVWLPGRAVRYLQSLGSAPLGDASRRKRSGKERMRRRK